MRQMRQKVFLNEISLTKKVDSIKTSGSCAVGRAEIADGDP